uniref:SH3 domain-containing protein n=1 Tax=Strigamia maritima TaxID=126957 RepID=T1J7Q9_STRMM
MSAMSWGTELWDQYDNIAAHTQKGIDFLEKYGHFIRDRCTIEVEYASKLKRLVKSYHLKKKDEEENQFTYCKAFVTMMNEINDLAGQHELISENLTTYIAKEVSSLVKDFKDERKKHLQEGAKIQINLQQSIGQLDKTKKGYERAFKETEKASENFQKADADLNLSRADVEKARGFAMLKEQQHDDSKNEYASQLQKTNDLQTQHYNELMPAVFQQLQEMDERRITKLQEFIKQSSLIEKQDSRLVIDRFKSGFQPPGDIPFEDLSCIKNGESNCTVSNVPTIRADSLTTKGTLSGGKVKKRGGLFGIFSSNKVRIYILLNYCRDGLSKMKSAYEQNPALGDPLTIEGQLTENGHRLDKLRQEQHKYYTYLTDPGSKSGTPVVNKKERNSISEDSLSRSASDSSVSNPVVNSNKGPAPTLPLPPYCSSNSPESGLGTSHTSLPDSDFDNGDYFDTEPLPVLGICRAMYTFDGKLRVIIIFTIINVIFGIVAQSEGSIPMIEGEELQVIELDQGDGWTRVRRGDNEEGFVPSSYVQCLFDTNSVNC